MRLLTTLACALLAPAALVGAAQAADRNVNIVNRTGMVMTEF